MNNNYFTKGGNMKKFLNFMLIACLMFSGMMVLSACKDDGAIKVANENQLVSALRDAKDGDVIKLTADIETDVQFVVNKKVTLNLNGKKIYNEDQGEAIWDDEDSWSLISVQEGGDLTINGNGTLKTKDGDSYAIDLRAEDAKLTIENGTFVGNVHAVYVRQGMVVINGGRFSIQQTYPIASKAYEFVLNCYDESYNDQTATISVTGGVFEKFNPNSCKAEGEATNFCAEGYACEQSTDNNGIIYSVTENA